MPELTPSEEFLTKMDDLADAINAQAKTLGSKTLDQLITMVQGLQKVYSERIDISPTTSSQTVQVPSGYDGVSNVVVGAIQLDTTHNSATANGIYSPSTGKYFSSFTVSIPEYDGSYTQPSS